MSAHKTKTAEEYREKLFAVLEQHQHEELKALKQRQDAKLTELEQHQEAELTRLKSLVHAADRRWRRFEALVAAGFLAMCTVIAWAVTRVGCS